MEFNEQEIYQNVDKLLALSDESLKMTFLQRVGLGDVFMNKDHMQTLQDMDLLTKGGRPNWSITHDKEIYEYAKERMGIEGHVPYPE